MGRKKHGTLNPTDKFRKDQRKKELKKNKEKRAAVRDNGLLRKDITQIHAQIQKINNVEEKTGKLDKGTKVKKRKLETQMHEVIKRKKDLEGSVPTRDEYEKAMTVPVSAAKTVNDLDEINQYRYEHPELSVYYHPTLNPYGAPPPGAAPMFRATSAANLLAGKEGPLALPSTEPNSTSKSEDSITAPLPPGPPPSDSNTVDEELESIPLPPGPPEEEELPPLPDVPPPEAETEEIPTEPPPIPPLFAAPPGGPPVGMLPMGFIPPPPGSILRPHFIPPVITDSPYAYIPPPSAFIPPVPVLPYGQMPPHMRPPQISPLPQPPAPIPATPGPQLPEPEVEPQPTILVPTALRVRRDTAVKPQAKPTIASAYIKPKKDEPTKTKDEAYDKFMQDMKDLGAV
jgi:hypothetical protein